MTMRMKTIVVDASLTASLLLPDEDAKAAQRLIASAHANGDALIAPSHYVIELLSVFGSARTRKRISAQEQVDFFREAMALPIALIPDRPPAERVYFLCDKHHLSPYDATYLALALHEGAQLATIDARLAAAAKSEGILWSQTKKK